jgi:immune inhibitor A
VLRASSVRAALWLLTLAFVVVLGIGGAVSAGAAADGLSAGGWDTRKYPQGQPVCAGALLNTNAPYWDQLDCGAGRVRMTGATPASSVVIEFLSEAGAVLGTAPATYAAAAATWNFSIVPAASWAPGAIRMRAQVGGVAADGFGELFFRQLGASVAAPSRAEGYQPGEPIPVTGRLYEQDTVGVDTVKKDVPATYKLRVIAASGAVRGIYGPFVANKGGDGRISETLPREATAGLTATQDTNYETTVALEVVDASYQDALTGTWRATRAPAGNITLTVPPGRLVLENDFISAVGWVKPGAAYPFRVFVRNFDAVERTGATVTIPAADGMSFTRATPGPSAGTVSVSAGSLTWKPGTVPARTDAGPGVRSLIVEARADGFAEDAQIVWKNLSTTATLTYAGGSAVTDTSAGPKVIPPKATFDTARYGFRPFPVVPVDYRDRPHDVSHSAERLLAVINSPDLPGSTFNLYREMSYGQLQPHGTVPSAARATADFAVQWSSPHRQQSGFAFTTPLPAGPCVGTTTGLAAGTPLYAERIRNGWYQLPGDTAYYGGDKISFANALVGNPAFIDNACGPIAKAVYDSALIADPDIDYSDYDTDKDGVVDFYMMVFAGAGGNGLSQLSVPPYDNIWPHSSSLEHYYRDAATGLTGYVSDDQLEDHQGRPLFYADSSRGAMTLTPTAFPVYVRVGPYNVNPEAAVEKASVISHEYGHSLGLPDYYSSGSGRATYGDWNLMATDKSQNMDVNAKQELGWIVPRVLAPGETTVAGWADSKVDTDRIDWKTPSGAPYTLTGSGVANGEAYVAKLPGQKVLDAAKVQAGASMSHVWWSQSGNDFNCAPVAGHNFDLFLPELATVPAGTPVTLTFKSYWDIEWDYDYGFVLSTTDGGQSYTSHASAKGYSTPREFNPNESSCQARYGNGLTGTSKSFADLTFVADRNPVDGHYPDGGFLPDQYDLSSLAGNAATLRFSYATDPGLARPGWFVDDVKVTAGDRVLYDSTFESGADETPIYNGGCKEGLQVATTCTAGWQYLNVDDLGEQDHAYYLELRDRSGFDFDGREQVDRSPIGFIPGLLLVYTNELEGYGNTGEAADDSPNQSPLDSEPQAGNPTPNLHDAAFTSAAGKSRFSDSVTAAQPAGWVDNYDDAGSLYADKLWHFDFNCLTFEVLAMSGTDIAPEQNLRADVKFTLGSGCSAYDFGNGSETNAKPTAVIQTKRTTVAVNRKVRFDGSRSFDDRDPPTALTYEWDFDGDGTYDATGRETAHTYTAPGAYDVKLRVTDTAGLRGTATLALTVE